ncbi:MAG TPA: CNNM domain-containing protein [Gemmatimonadaceae bacterium]|nr:CNNM domain-containing protein [Gemmatimonadaceae bacterium]
MIGSQSLLLAICVLTVAALTAGGMAMRSVSRIWLRHWVEQQLRGSRAAMAYLERPQRLIIAASSTVALVLVLSGALLATEYAHQPLRLAIALAGFAATVIVVGQLLPRAIARRFAPAVASFLSPLLEAAAIIASPIVGAGRWASRPFERPASEDSGGERDAIQDLLREGELEGVGEREEMEIITGVMEFGEKLVRDVMIPRDEIFAIEQSASAREIAEEFATSAFSRVPVYRGTIDHVVGMVHAFDVLKMRGEQMPALRPVAFAAHDTPCSELLFRMLRKSLHMAIIQDAERTVGLVTLEDLLEELVGDIRDEHDEPAPRGES